MCNQHKPCKIKDGTKFLPHLLVTSVAATGGKKIPKPRSRAFAPLGARALWELKEFIYC